MFRDPQGTDKCFTSDTGKQAVQSLLPLKKLKGGYFCAAERHEENSWFKQILLKAAQSRVFVLLWSHQSNTQHLSNVPSHSTDQADNAERISTAQDTTRKPATSFGSTKLYVQRNSCVWTTVQSARLDTGGPRAGCHQRTEDGSRRRNSALPFVKGYPSRDMKLGKATYFCTLFSSGFTLLSRKGF